MKAVDVDHGMNLGPQPCTLLGPCQPAISENHSAQRSSYPCTGVDPQLGMVSLCRLAAIQKGTQQTYKGSHRTEL